MKKWTAQTIINSAICTYRMNLFKYLNKNYYWENVAFNYDSLISWCSKKRSITTIHSYQASKKKKKMIKKTWERIPHSACELMYHQKRCRSLRLYTTLDAARNISVMDVIYSVGYISICMRSREAKIDIFLQHHWHVIDHDCMSPLYWVGRQLYVWYFLFLSIQPVPSHPLEEEIDHQLRLPLSRMLESREKNKKKR
jgi:hypothetical protein